MKISAVAAMLALTACSQALGASLVSAAAVSDAGAAAFLAEANVEEQRYCQGSCFGVAECGVSYRAEGRGGKCVALRRDAGP